MESKLEELVGRYRELGIDSQLDYDKYYLYSIITHSTAIEGSTITELENQIMFDNGISLKGKSIIEQNMNLDLKAAYEKALIFAKERAAITPNRLKELSALTMKNTGAEYHTMLGNFSSANGDFRLLNVTAGVGGKSYMSFAKVPVKLDELCNDINLRRSKAKAMSIQELYNLSFDAHYNLVTIHPWADGNGRMARLLMNWIQFEYNLIPTRIFAAEKEDYIKALVATRTAGDIDIFRRYMTDTTIRHLKNDISQYLQSVDEPATLYVKIKTSDGIIQLLRENPRYSAKALAGALGLSVKGIEKQFAQLKSSGKIRRIGANKNGYWEINDTIAEK